MNTQLTLWNNFDHVHLIDLSGYAQAITHWMPWFRSVVGMREDYIHGIESGTNT